MTFIYFLLMALLGLAIYYGIALNKFNQETPSLNFGQTFSLYFKNRLYALITNLLILVAFSILLAVDKEGWFMKFLTGNTIDGSLTVQFYFISLSIGFLGQSLFSLLMGKRTPIAGLNDTEVKP